jgi:Zn-dependent protease with chaperone function
MLKMKAAGSEERAPLLAGKTALSLAPSRIGHPWFAICLIFLLALGSALLGSAQSAQPGTPQPQPQVSLATANSGSPQQAYSLPPEKLAKALAYSHIRQILELTETLWSLIVLWLLLATRTAASLAAVLGHCTRRHWLQGLLFFAAFLILTTLADMPLAWIGHLASLHYGISVQSWSSWLLDLTKSLGLTVLIGAPLLLLFNWIVARWPRRYWLGAWIATVPLMVLGTLISPLLEPVFNKFEPLNQHHPELVARLEQVVARTGEKIPPERFFLMKASEKSNGLNAYVSGIGSTKRIVVWDTTAGRIPDDEVLFIFAHESGHYVLNHIPKGLAVSAVFLFFLFWACARLAERLARHYDTRWQLYENETANQQYPPLASRAGFIVLLLTVSIAGFVFAPLSNAYSRHIEHEADVYGQEALHSIVADPQKTAVSSFNHLGEAWLEDPNPSPFFEFWFYSHPSTQHRADFALHYNPWANGGHGKFFAR